LKVFNLGISLVYWGIRVQNFIPIHSDLALLLYDAWGLLCITFLFMIWKLLV